MDCLGSIELVFECLRAAIAINDDTSTNNG